MLRPHHCFSAIIIADAGLVVAAANTTIPSLSNTVRIESHFALGPPQQFLFANFDSQALPHMLSFVELDVAFDDQEFVDIDALVSARDDWTVKSKLVFRGR